MYKDDKVSVLCEKNYPRENIFYGMGVNVYLGNIFSRACELSFPGKTVLYFQEKLRRETK
jgi:hypothetical protein